MRTCYQTLRHKLKSVVVLAPQAEERRGKCTWRTIFVFQPASLLLRCCSTVWITLHHKLKSVVVKLRGSQLVPLLAPQAEERSGTSMFHELRNVGVLTTPSPRAHGRTLGLLQQSFARTTLRRRWRCQSAALLR